jgi:hypothetical protein
MGMSVALAQMSRTLNRVPSRNSSSDSATEYGSSDGELFNTHTATASPGCGLHQICIASRGCSQHTTFPFPHPGEPDAVGPPAVIFSAPAGVQLRTSQPGWPDQRWLTLIASMFEMIGHISSICLLLSRSRPSINGDEITHHPPKWARLHSKVHHLSNWPSSNMSGYAQQPCVARGCLRSRNRLVVCRL